MIKVKNFLKSKSRSAQLKTKLRVFGQKIFSNRRFKGTKMKSTYTTNHRK